MSFSLFLSLSAASAARKLSKQKRGEKWSRNFFLLSDICLLMARNDDTVLMREGGKGGFVCIQQTFGGLYRQIGAGGDERVGGKGGFSRTDFSLACIGRGK